MKSKQFKVIHQKKENDSDKNKSNLDTPVKVDNNNKEKTIRDERNKLIDDILKNQLSILRMGSDFWLMILGREIFLFAVLLFFYKSKMFRTEFIPSTSLYSELRISGSYKLMYLLHIISYIISTDIVLFYGLYKIRTMNIVTNDKDKIAFIKLSSAKVVGIKIILTLVFIPIFYLSRNWRYVCCLEYMITSAGSLLVTKYLCNKFKNKLFFD